MASDKIPVLVNISADQVVEFLKERGTLVEVVRCGECTHRKDSIQCPLYSEGIETADDWFCADGEREVQE